VAGQLSTVGIVPSPDGASPPIIVAQINGHDQGLCRLELIQPVCTPTIDTIPSQEPLFADTQCQISCEWIWTEPSEGVPLDMG